MFDYQVDRIDTLTDKGVTLVSNKENIDTDTPTGKFMLTVFAALSQLEREQIKQRQREGIEIAKAQGKYKGRKSISIDWSKFEKLYDEWKSGAITAKEFQRRMNLKANTFYRRVREYEETHSIIADMGNSKSEEENVPTAAPYQLSLLNEKHPVSGTETAQD